MKRVFKKRDITCFLKRIIITNLNHCHPPENQNKIRLGIKRVLLCVLMLGLIITSYGQTIDNTPATLIGSSGGSTEMGQSFTATVTGYIVNIQCVNDASEATNLKIYSGEGVGGTLLHTQAVNLIDTYTNTTTYSYNTIVLDATIPITSGNSYSFVFDNAHPGLGAETYAGGSLIDTGVVSTIDSPFRVVQQASIVWDGSTSSAWGVGTNWVGDAVPSNTDDVTIENAGTPPVITTDITVGNVIINASASLVINGSGSLTATKNIENDGTLVAQSGSSLIVQGTSTDIMTYKRNLSTTNWYLVSSPVSQTVVKYIADNPIELGSGSGVSQNVALAPYNNNGATANDRWDYYTVGQTDGANGDDTTDLLVSGKGYITKRTSIGNIDFTGTIPTSDIGIPISVGTANSFNAVGNPYPSYIAANNGADATNNILKVNDTDNDFLSESTIWFWDQSLNGGAGSYTQLNHASSARFIAPGQGFFVSANGSNTFSITEAMQSHQATDVFNRNNSNRPEIKLKMFDAVNTTETDIFYINGTTTGFDNGYDSTIFGGDSSNFKVYTHLVSDSQGQNLGIQSLPDNNFENMVIPVGVDSASGTEISFTVESTNIPDGLHVFLEDREHNIFTQLDVDGGVYTVQLTTDNNGIGRFYIHTTTQEILGIGDASTIESISIYQSDKDILRIVGFPQGKASIQLYTISGREVMNDSFESSGLNDIHIGGFAKGLYIVRLKNELGSVNRKIVIY